MLKRWLLNVVILMLVAYLLQGLMYSGPVALFAAAAILGLVNASIRPFLIAITFPITIITLGLFIFIISALMLQLTAWLVPGFAIANFGTALVAALLFAIFNMVFSSAVR